MVGLAGKDRFEGARRGSALYKPARLGRWCVIGSRRQGTRVPVGQVRIGTGGERGWAGRYRVGSNMAGAVVQVRLLRLAWRAPVGLG